MTTLTASASRNDYIRDNVQSELEFDPRISSSSDIAVSAKDGVVTLSGYVPNYWEKDAAGKAAQRVYGVKAVANDIEVKLTTMRTDPDIARDVLHALDTHIMIPNDKIKVTVKNGYVTLEGKVDWQYESHLAESSVKILKGVKGITNKIEVKPHASPAEVKTKIQDALERSAELDARRIRVETSDGTVNLFGNVRSWAEQSDAVRAAWSAPGVTNVRSNLTIAA